MVAAELRRLSASIVADKLKGRHVKNDTATSIDYIEIKVLDIDRAKAFYGIFGWSFEDFGEEYTSFNHGKGFGGLSKADTILGGGPLIVLYTDELETLKAKIADAGGFITGKVIDFPGGIRFHFKDPFGNELAAWTKARSK